MMVRTFATLALLFSAGCGCGSAPDSTPPGQTPLTDYFSGKIAYDEMTALLAERFNTAFVPPFVEGMPTAGNASYQGYFLAEIQTDPQTTRLLGLATVNANFDSGTISGAASDFVGVDRTGAMDDYSGGVSMTGGSVGVNRPNDFLLPYSGSLNGNGEIVSLSGTLLGTFKGDPVLGILGEDSAPSTAIDSNPFTGQVNLSALGL
jgi:hypothetical protein